ncbi:MAG: glycoside hydrolase family 127 protein [Nonomuraea sp.]|nr:glycoside hydrolase family 127 protein [Streptomyces sp.]NUP84049.1 glycoside hydrolase family 127 protein [Nonomuraea sp.]
MTDTATPADTGHSPLAVLRPIDQRRVRVADPFWAPRRQVMADTSLEAQYQRCEDYGLIDNFRRAAGRLDGDFAGMFYADSDVYKWLEAACWTLADQPRHAIGKRVADVAELIEAAQDDDGYLNTYFTGPRADQRWSNLRHRHELYCAGHLIQAAVAHHRATGSTRLLGVATRLAAHLDARFGPQGARAACGHPEAEMALVELFRVTGDERHLVLARRMIDARGRTPSEIPGHEPTYGGDSWAIQDHLPFTEQTEMAGHAVRALYLYGGAADLLLEGHGDDLAETLRAAWRDLRDHKVYVTGGVGSRWHYEAIGRPYELPNERAYAETCAAIAQIQLAWRLLLHTGKGEYRDAIERALYNGVACGVDLDGERFFYQNPLADRGGHRRSPWFDTACCPPNIARTLASLPGYAWTTDDDGGVWAHLYLQGEATADTPDGPVTLETSTEYPWQGSVRIRVRADGPRAFALRLPVPAWCAAWTCSLPGEVEDGYLRIDRTWQPGDEVELTLDMPVRLTSAHPRVLADQGRVAVERGPLVYCLEQADHDDADVWDVRLPADADWRVEHESGLLGGVTVLSCQARAEEHGPGPLYRPHTATPSRPVHVRAVPYAVWANREPGPMQVWIPLS